MPPDLLVVATAYALYILPVVLVFAAMAALSDFLERRFK